MDDLGERMDDVLLLAFTEFGRTAAQNGTAGTDHGWAGCLFAVGGAVARASSTSGPSRRVVAEWPGLEQEQLQDGRDLLHTTDFRDVLGELVRVHLGNPNVEELFPAHAFSPVGLVA